MDLVWLIVAFVLIMFLGQSCSDQGFNANVNGSKFHFKIGDPPKTTPTPVDTKD